MDCENAHDGRGLSGAQSSNLAMSIIGAEDEDFENDLDQTVDDQCSHFNSIELLKSRPTHLLVFLHHVILQFDCAPVLCYLHADLFRHLSAKETKKQFVEFYNTFLDKGATLRVQIPSHITYELDRTRPDLITEDMQKQFARDVQSLQSAEVARQLDDFRQKRMMGMTPNEHELNEVDSHYPTDRVPRDMKEKAVAEMLLEKLESNPSIVPDEDKFSAIFSAVAFYMKQLGVKTRAPDSKKSKFFWRKEKEKKTEKLKAKNLFPDSVRWPFNNNEIKPSRVDPEADRDKSNTERKGSGSSSVHRGSASEGTPAIFQSRKPTLTPSIPQVPEASDAASGNTVVPPNPEASHCDIGVTISRPDPPAALDVGDASLVSLATGMSVLEPAVDILLEEAHEKDNTDVPPPFDSLPVSPTPATPVQQEEMEPRLLELEQDPPNWKELASSNVLSKLSKKEIKRQEVINELFATEHAHVRMLSVLQTVFSRPLEREEIMTIAEVSTIFPSLDDIIDMHYNFYENLKKLREGDGFVVKIISKQLLSRFDGSEGEWFQKLTARFCSYQSWALDLIKSKQKKDPRFNAFILEAESKPQCRRLQLKDIIPIEMQRLTKYPLLLENIAKTTEDNAERENIQQAAECCRKILNHVNDEVKRMENLLTLKEYQRRLDTSGLKPSNELYMEYKGFDLNTKVMLFEGPLTWRVTKEKAIEVQAVLLADLLVLFQKQDDKMLLKCQSKSIIAAQEGKQVSDKQMLSPIIKLDSAFLRDVATDNKAFYVIFTWESGAQIYELVAQSVAERRMWMGKIKLAVDELKNSGASKLDRKRHGSMPAPSHPPAYGITMQPPLSPTENGADPLKNNTGRDKELGDDKSRHSQPSLIDYLTVNGFDPLAYSNTAPERSALAALDQAKSLKRLLIGSISLSEDSQQDGESTAARIEPDTEPRETPAEEPDAEGQEDREGEQVKGEEEGGIAAPLVLSHERMEEVRRRLESLEEKLKRLQNVEEEYHRLQEALAKFTIQGVKYN